MLFLFSATRILLSTGLVQITEENIEDSIIDSQCFYKCIHFKKEIGIFVYYVDNEKEPAKIKIIEITENNSEYSLNNYIPDFVESLSAINSNKYFSYNDIIKL